jgi:hypothetical protein
MSQSHNCVLLPAEASTKRYVIPSFKVTCQIHVLLQQHVRFEALNSIGKVYSLAYPEMYQFLCRFPVVN